jgi:hypothetical protein
LHYTFSKYDIHWSVQTKGQRRRQRGVDKGAGSRSDNLSDLGRRLGLVELVEVIRGLSALVERRSEGTQVSPAAEAGGGPGGPDQDGPAPDRAAEWGAEPLAGSVGWEPEQSGQIVHTAK